MKKILILLTLFVVTGLSAVTRTCEISYIYKNDELSESAVYYARNKAVSEALTKYAVNLFDESPLLEKERKKYNRSDFANDFTRLMLIYSYKLTKNITDLEPPKIDEQNNLVLVKISCEIDEKELTERIKTGLTNKEAVLTFIDKFKTAHINQDYAYLSAILQNTSLFIDYFHDKNYAQMSVKEQTADRRLQADAYLKKLKLFYKKHSETKMQYSDIELQIDPCSDQIYGITLKQTLNSPNYNDESYLFFIVMLVDNTPKIFIFAWQPARDENGNVVDTWKTLFKMSNFDY